MSSARIRTSSGAPFSRRLLIAPVITASGVRRSCEKALRLRWAHPEHTGGAATRNQRQIQRLAGRQRAGTKASQLAVIVDPLRHTLVVPIRRENHLFAHLRTPPAADIAPR